VPNPPKPTERKRRAGNPGKRRLPEPISIVPASEAPPVPPEGLEAVGRALWELVWRDGSTWLAPSDAPLVRMLCENADERERWLTLVAEVGPTFTTEKGYVGLHPGVAQVRVLGREMITIFSLLGFSPSDRARLGLAEVRRMTGLAELLERRRTDLGR
jgi:P27 family predicted phage terminase small subunit